jgi:hypothetical protein
MEPLIQQMLDFHKFKSHLIEVMHDSFFNLCGTYMKHSKDHNYSPSSALTDVLIDLFAVIFDLDALKNAKGFMNNDLSMYKRYIYLC